jgi:long-chain acyl-CoA synthetase
VDQIVVVGNDRPHLVALVMPNHAALDEALGRDASSSPDADARTVTAAFDLVKDDLSIQGASLAPHEQIRNFTILSAPLSMENGELTPSLKLRRHQIEARHRETIERLYRRERTS